MQRPLIDSHLDLAFNAMHFNRDLLQSLEEIAAAEAELYDTPFRTRPTVSLPELRKANIALSLCTVLSRCKPDQLPWKRAEIDYATPRQTFAAGQAQVAYYEQLQREGEIVLIKDRQALARHWQAWTSSDDTSQLPLGMILSMEGADPILTPDQASLWFDQGLRVVGLAHYGPHPYAFGTGSNGPLPERAKPLLDAFAQLGIIVDMTHTTDRSFFDTLDHFSGPVLASHNNCRSLVDGDRQFSDTQIQRLIERGGVIGVAFDSWMLCPGYTFSRSKEKLTHPRHDPQRTPRSQVPLSNAADHIDHICQLAGNDRHVGIGSDLDGGFGTEQTPDGLDSIADLHKMADILDSRGYSAESIDRIFYRNWLDFFLEQLP